MDWNMVFLWALAVYVLLITFLYTILRSEVESLRKENDMLFIALDQMATRFSRYNVRVNIFRKNGGVYVFYDDWKNLEKELNNE